MAETQKITSGVAEDRQIELSPQQGISFPKTRESNKKRKRKKKCMTSGSGNDLVTQFVVELVVKRRQATNVCPCEPMGKKESPIHPQSTKKTVQRTEKNFASKDPHRSSCRGCGVSVAFTVPSRAPATELGAYLSGIRAVIRVWRGSLGVLTNINHQSEVENWHQSCGSRDWHIQMRRLLN